MSDDGIVRVGAWALRPDVARTREAHARLVRSGAADCSCVGCANFEAARGQLLEGPLGALLEQLGISPPWEVEAYEMGRVPSGRQLYGAWFHFVGSIESGPSAPAAASTPALEALAPHLSVGFHHGCQLARDSFQGLPLVQVEIVVELPWVISAPRPD